jgi:hypothetical protein
MLISIGPNEDPIVRAAELMRSEPADVQEKLAGLMHEMQHKAPSNWLKPCIECSNCGLAAAVTHFRSLSSKLRLTAVSEGWSVRERACEESYNFYDLEYTRAEEMSEIPSLNMGIFVPHPGRSSDLYYAMSHFCHDTAVDFTKCCTQMRSLFASKEDPTVDIAFVSIDTSPQLGLHIWQSGASDNLTAIDLMIDETRHIIRLGTQDHAVLSVGIFCTIHYLPVHSCLQIFQQLKAVNQSFSRGRAKSKIETLCRPEEHTFGIFEEKRNDDVPMASTDTCLEFWRKACEESNKLSKEGSSSQNHGFAINCDFFLLSLEGITKTTDVTQRNQYPPSIEV